MAIDGAEKSADRQNSICGGGREEEGEPDAKRKEGAECSDGLLPVGYFPLGHPFALKRNFISPILSGAPGSNFVK